ncbi:hypothetical protein [Chamaesiphon sp.]|uniref:hypothetical protein n=1 Tax=Chamaesiphon sp. TaxID=2814140 RepID=UPI0035931BFE
MTPLSITDLAESTAKCFEYSRDIAIFTPEQRDKWLIRGFKLSSALSILVGALFKSSVDPKIIEANKKLREINDRLKDKKKSLSDFPDTIKKIDDVISILNIFIGFIV